MEGRAPREAITNCNGSGLREVSFESDLTQLINEDKIPVEIYGVVSYIILFALFFYLLFTFSSFNWITRDVNAVADELAKQCLNVTETFVAST